MAQGRTAAMIAESKGQPINPALTGQPGGMNAAATEKAEAAESATSPELKAAKAQ